MYVRTKRVPRLGSLGFDTEEFASIVGTSAKAAGTVISASKGGGGGSAPAQKPAATGANGTNWLESMSNTDLAIGGIAAMALVLAITR